MTLNTVLKQAARRSPEVSSKQSNNSLPENVEHCGDEPE